ncbi:MAG: response regulator [Candidatus Komeilibacteria bacterium]|nr:response regulator [Candidatus Komeilibacteria bacterium]
MSKGRVLFIDDDNFLRKVYQTELTEKGFEVHLAADGEEGLQKVAEVHPDLLILDLIMPKKNGFEVLSDLQRFEETRAIPVIVLSNLGQSEDQKRALDLGAVEYLVKDNTTLDIISEKINYHLHAVSTKQRTVPGAATKGTGTLTEELAQRKQQKTQASTDAAPEQQQKAPSASGKNFCSSCGYKLSAHAKFCPNCGAQQYP